MKQRSSILLIICAVGMHACTAVERGVVTTGPRSATQHTTTTGTGSLSREALSPSVPDETGTVSGKQHSGSWTIEYEVSGGFAGIRRHLKLSSDGRLSVTDLKQKKHIEQQASSEQLAEIANLLTKIDFSRAPGTRPLFSNRCADCFQHVLTTVVKGQRNTLAFDDITLKDSESAPLTRLLVSMINQALVKQGP